MAPSRSAGRTLVIELLDELAPNGRGESIELILGVTHDGTDRVLPLLRRRTTQTYLTGGVCASPRVDYETEDGSGQLSVGVQVSPAEQGSGETVTRNGRGFVACSEGTRIRVTEDVGNEIREDVLSDSLDRETLMQIADTITYDPVHE